MFKNNIGIILFENSKLNIILSNKYDKNSFIEFLDNLKKIYLMIGNDFEIISDLSNVNLFIIPTNVHFKIAKFFTENFIISEKYLSKITIISKNSFICSILNNFFKIYKTPHLIKFENSINKIQSL